MQSSTQSFRDLAVYQLARRCSIDVYALALDFPTHRDDDVPRRLLATAHSVRAHIAAAWGTRRQRAALIEQLSTAQLQAAEMQTWIEAAVATGYLSPEAAQDLHDRYRHLYTVLDHLMESALAEKTQPIADTPDDLPATA
ncbi:four helix bundle protein [Leptolyngbya sp. PCC 6406]|uniref:four helix bundle protein n=1 Tax=Leptolyngbya sp. PCC 6406 TaxID=1173264 RepID=UPI0002ACE6AD|nr:four helix bundle protein [Leptolyngbya sp. PCC 6406]